MEDFRNCSEVGESLSNLKQVILEHWEKLVRDNIYKAESEPAHLLRDDVPGILDQLSVILHEGQADYVKLGKAHGLQRARETNYSIADLLTEFSCLREALMDYLYPVGNLKCTKLLQKYIDVLCKHSVIEFTKEQSRQYSSKIPGMDQASSLQLRV